MERIGTLSINVNTDDLNYGAVLHSYAFQKYLRDKCSFPVEVIDYTMSMYSNYDLKYPTMGYIKDKNYQQAVLSLVRFISQIKKYEKFKTFINNNMTLSRKKYDCNSISSDTLPYDTIICESDVIWSPQSLGGHFDKSFLLSYPNMKSIKKVSYAASLANAILTKEEELELSTALSDFKAVSCREKYAVNYLKKFVSKDIEYVLDPVFLLEKDDYLPIISERNIPYPYVLIYFPLEYNNQLIKAAKKFASKKGYKVVELSRYPWEIFRHKTVLDAGIEDFLSLIYNAETIFTNSFHATAFSLIFCKDFYCFKRCSGKKCEDLLDTVGLRERFIEGSFIEQEPIDYNPVYNHLNKYIAKSKQYITLNVLN